MVRGFQEKTSAATAAAFAGRLGYNPPMALQLVEKQVIFDGVKVRLELHHLEPEEGGKRHRREVCVHPGAVVILPILDDQTVVLIRVRRYAVGRTLLELPAG